MAEREKSEDIVVFITRRSGVCAECAVELFDGNLIRIENERVLCLDCADLGHLEFLPSGDTALTRRATKHSRLRAVVVQWSRARKRYERQGILAAPAAIRQAEAETLADADQRAAARVQAAERRAALEPVFLEQLAAALRALYPGLPAAEAAAIAEWTGQKHSGRVGRSAAAKDFDPAALRLAVVAHIRHVHTDYDVRLMRHGDRQRARHEVGARIDEILTRWQTG